MYGVINPVYLDSEMQLMNSEIFGVEQQRHSGDGKRMNSL